MGGADKAALRLGGMRLIDRALARLGPQVDALAIAAGDAPGRFADLDLPALADPLPGRAGPLAGLLAGLRFAAATGAAEVATVAVDTPFFPEDLVARLAAARAGDRPAIAATRDAAGMLRADAAFGLWPASLAPALAAALADGTRRVRAFADSRDARRVAFPDAEAFLNLNRPDDLARAEARLAGAP
jgi:molybdopterin-guanine dinucleotide biosynthesis protein A